MTDAIDIFPKNDLMKGALQPLVGDSLFVSDGETWKRQRRMVEPAFSFMRITKAFAAMQKAVGDHVAMLDQRAESGEVENTVRQMMSAVRWLIEKSSENGSPLSAR